MLLMHRHEKGLRLLTQLVAAEQIGETVLAFEHRPQRAPHDGDAIDQAIGIDLDHVHCIGCRTAQPNRVKRDDAVFTLGDPGAGRRIDDGLHRLDHTPDLYLADEGVVEDRAAQNNFLADMLGR